MSTRVDQAQQVNIAKPITSQGVQTTEMPNSVMNPNMETKPEEQVSIRNLREDIYNKLQTLCEKYNIDLNKLKEINALEQILGCKTPEELAEKSNEEIQAAIDALNLACKRAYGQRLRAFIGRDASEEFIQSLPQKAIDARVMSDTGVTNWKRFISNINTKDTLEAELVSRGYLKEGEPVTDVALQEYFKKEVLNITGEETEKKLLKKYEKALAKFGNLQLKYTNEHERLALTSVIQLLRADHRALAQKVSLEINSNNPDLQDKVAAKNVTYYVENTGTPDAFNKTVSQEDAMTMTQSNFKAMSPESRSAALDYQQKRLQEILNKPEAERTQAENLYIEKTQNWETAATVAALAEESEFDLVNKAIENAKDAGVNNELINKLVKEYFGGENTPEYQQFKAALEVAQKKAENQTLVAGKVASSAAKASAAKVSTETTGSSREASRVISAVTENATNTSNPISTLVVNLFVNNQQAMTLAKKDIVANAETILKFREENLPEVVSPTLDMYLNNGGTLKLYLNSKPNEMHSALKDAFNMFNRLNDEDKDLAIAYYAQLDEERQSTILQEVGNTALSILLKYASNKTLANLDKKDLNNSIAQHLFEQRKEQIQETSLA